MANEMTVYKAITTMGQAVVSMARSVKINRSVRKQDTAVFEEQLRYIKAACRAKGYGELTRLNVDEMEKTFQRITLKNFSGEMLDMSMGLLKMQYQALCQNIQKYAMD